MSDLYQQLLEEVAKREAELKTAQAEFERTQEAAKKAAEALRNAAAYLKPGSSSSSETSAAPATRAPEPLRQSIAKQPSFIDVVAGSVAEMTTEITTARVFEKLSAEGVALGDDPRTKISTALSRLEQRGALVKAVTGGTGRAHSYQKPNPPIGLTNSDGGEQG